MGLDGLFGVGVGSVRSPIRSLMGRQAFDWGDNWLQEEVESAKMIESLCNRSRTNN